MLCRDGSKKESSGPGDPLQEAYRVSAGIVRHGNYKKAEV